MLGHILCSVRDTPSRGLQPDPLRWSTTKKAHRASWTDCAAGLTPRISVCFRPFAAHVPFRPTPAGFHSDPQKAAELGQKGGRRNRHTYETPLQQGRQRLRSVPSFLLSGIAELYIGARSVLITRGWGWDRSLSALRNRRLAASASRNADSKKSMVAPLESMARYK